MWTRANCGREFRLNRNSFNLVCFRFYFPTSLWERKKKLSGEKNCVTELDFKVLSVITPLCMSRLTMCNLSITVDHVTVAFKELRLFFHVSVELSAFHQWDFFFSVCLFLCFHSYSLLSLNQLHTVEILPCPSCVQLCLNLNLSYKTNQVWRGSFLPIWQIGGEGEGGASNFTIFVVKLFSGSWKQSALHVSIFQSFSALISFSCWVVFIIIINTIIVMIIIAAAAALWLL